MWFLQSQGLESRGCMKFSLNVSVALIRSSFGFPYSELRTLVPIQGRMVQSMHSPNSVRGRSASQKL